MKKYIFTVLCIALLVAIVSAFPKEDIRETNQTATSRNGDVYKEALITIGGVDFQGFVADTNTLREQGLGGFSGLGKREAMLFVFDEPNNYGFWMKDMLFSIDMVWLDEGGKVISLEKNVSPATFPNIFLPTGPALFVIEFNAGTLDVLGTKIGDTITIAIEA